MKTKEKIPNLIYAARDGNGILFLYRGYPPKWDKSDKTFVGHIGGNVVNFIDNKD